MNPKILIFVCFAISSCLSSETSTTKLENVMTSAPPTSPAPVPSASGTPSTDSKATTDKSAPASASTPATDNNVSEKPTADQAHPTIISSNPQKERDLFTVTTGNCFKQFEKIRNSTQGNLAPEKVILSLSGSLSPMDYCKQQTLITELNITCSNLSSPVNDGDRATASVSNGFTALFNVVCASSSTALKAFPDNDGVCDSAVKSAVKECSKTLNTPATPIMAQYPSELINNMMMFSSFNCASLKEAKSCVAGALKKCSEEQQTAIIALLDPIMTVPCMPAASASDVPTSPTAASGSTTTTIVPATTPRGRNAASHFQSANLFVAVLPVLLLVFNY